MRALAWAGAVTFAAIWVAGLVGSFIRTWRAVRDGLGRRREDPCHVPLRSRLRERRRLARYRLRRRRCYEGGHESARLTADERLAFARIVTAERRRQPLAPEVRYERRPR